ncbi:NAD(P)/FAD-dependent oxidoreductase [Shouchella rhizosphaerae]|uniref:NAD(P)/FAD-dependent oxidoreductase n=1 Tax=Shouchella rhizosphaerae TaxID=866786 RepID=UPI002040BE6B|nr:FAD-binding oxidoreductase [Shouchella rhizosphaerae]MCM3379540.1 FAD-binding oxidoreductase [Shouchella rhizosphaerae]
MTTIVVGAGIVGASAAYHLARKGEDVILVDKRFKGEATAAGAGIVCPWISKTDDPDWYRLARNGALYYPELMERLKQDGEEHVGFAFVGALGVNEEESELAAMEARANQRKQDTPEVGEIKRLSYGEAKALFPPLKEGLEAVYVEGAARLDGRLLRDALCRAAKKHGAQVVEGEACLVYEEEAICGVEVEGTVYEGDTVIAASGAWAKQLAESIGITIEVEPQKGQIAHIGMEGYDTSKWPVVLPQTSHYLVCFDDARVVIGATRETGSGFDYRLTAGGVYEVLDEGLRVAPGLSEGSLREVRIGFRPASKDLKPLLGRVKALKGLVIATGLGASGLTMGPYVGTLAAALAVGEEPPIDLAPYNPLRKC